MRLIVTLIAAYLTTLSTLVETKNTSYVSCNAELIVENNRSSKSADNEGAQFVMVLTNTSSTFETYQIAVKNITGNCKKGNSRHNLSSLSQNINLELELQNSQFEQLDPMSANQTEIELNSGQSYKFIVDVQVPRGATYNVWSCVEVEVTANDCKSLSETKTLSVYVVDPNEG